MLSVQSERAKGTLRCSALSRVLFCFDFFFLFLFFKLLLLWTLETGKSYRKGERNTETSLKAGGTAWPPIPHMTLKNTLERQVGPCLSVSIIEQQQIEPQLLPTSVLGAFHMLLCLILAASQQGRGCWRYFMVAEMETQRH